MHVFFCCGKVRYALFTAYSIKRRVRFSQKQSVVLARDLGVELPSMNGVQQQVEPERNPDDRENANDLDSNVTEFDNTNDEPDINDACRSSDLPTENEANTNGYLGELSDSNVIEFDNTNNKLDFPAACDNNNHIENEKGADIGPRLIELDHIKQNYDIDDASDNNHFDIEKGAHTAACHGHTNVLGEHDEKKEYPEDRYKYVKVKIQQLIRRRPHPLFIGHIRAHSDLPGPLTEANALADLATRQAFTVVVNPLDQARREHQLHHLNSRTLRLRFKLTKQQVRDIVKHCPACVTSHPVPHLGVNPRGLVPNMLWQMDVTHFPEFGRHKYLHVSVDTFSGFIYATPHAGEAVKDVIATFWRKSVGANEAGLEDLVSALTCVGGCQVPVNQSWVFINFLLFFIPTLVMITVYTKIFFIAKQQAQKIERMSDHTAKASDSYKERVAKRKRKAAKTLGIAVAAFLLSWLPYFIDSIIDAFLGFITPTGKNYGVINSNFCSVTRFLNNKAQRTGHSSEALYIAVTDPLVYPTKFSVSVSGICISISWTLPLVYSSAVFYTGISARGNESLRTFVRYGTQITL
ncbi:hypothetical protein STEG23_010212 [Scotinomys teguina]